MRDLQPMLANSEIPHPTKVRFPVLASPKIDGIRCLGVAGKAMSRKLIEIPNKRVQALFAAHPALTGLDGELVSGAPYSTGEGDDVFNRSGTVVSTADSTGPFALYVFEIWDSEATAADRYARLLEMAPSWPEQVKIVPQILCETLEQLAEAHQTFMSMGFEGTMLKHPGRRYKRGRSTPVASAEWVLLKWKEFVTSEAEILEVIQGESNQNEASVDALGHTKRSTAKAGKVLRDTAGAFRMRDVHTKVEFKAGIPGDAAAVLAIWRRAQRGEVVGEIWMYRFQRVGTVIKPRFAQAVGPRPAFDLEIAA